MKTIMFALSAAAMLVAPAITLAQPVNPAAMSAPAAAPTKMITPAGEVNAKSTPTRHKRHHMLRRHVAHKAKMASPTKALSDASMARAPIPKAK
jgi:hypothetical protein